MELKHMAKYKVLSQVNKKSEKLCVCYECFVDFIFRYRQRKQKTTSNETTLYPLNRDLKQ